MKKQFTILMAGLLITASIGLAQRVRVVHASPDAPPVDIYVDGQKVLQELPFGEYSAYLDVPNGTREIGVFLAGTDTLVLRRTTLIESTIDYTVVANGFAASDPALDLLILKDRNREPNTGRAMVRVIHAAPSAPGVDVYFTTPFLAFSATKPVLANVPFGVASDYLMVPADEGGTDYQARVAVAGTETVAIDSGRLVLESKDVRTIIALDPPGEDAGFQAIVLRDRN